MTGMHMRPRAIRLFERIVLAWIVVSSVKVVLSWHQVAEAVQNPQLRASKLTEDMITASLLIGLFVPLLLWYLVARRASNVAKWAFMGLTVFGVLGFVQALTNPVMPLGLVTLFGAVALALQMYAAWLLFDPEAKHWLDTKGADPAS